MKYHVMALGLNLTPIEADGPYNAYWKYKDLIKEKYKGSIPDDLKYIVYLDEVDEDDENSFYRHTFYFDNEGIIEHELTEEEKWKRVSK